MLWHGMGDDVVFWRRVLELTGWLVVRQQFLPGVLHNFTSKITDPTPFTMVSPYGLAFAGNNGLLVSDVSHNRVLFFPFTKISVKPLASAMGI